MTDLSLTDLVDYVSKSGTTKLTHAKKLKNREAYSPEKDFYRKLRMDIQEYHKSGKTNKKDLDKIISFTPDPKKLGSYQACVKGYKKWLGKKTYTNFDPPHYHWVRGAVDVRVNPELGLEIGGVQCIVKLYFKSESLKKINADLILALMGDALGAPTANQEYAVLDVQKSKMFSTNVPDVALMPLVEGEAASLATIWSNLP